MEDCEQKSTNGERRRERLCLIALVCLLLIATFTRFETLTQRPMWGDETFVLSIVRSATSLEHLWGIGQMDYGRHPPLHYALMYYLEPLARPDLSLRAPSALFGIAYIGILVGIGRALFGRRVGLLAGLMATLSVYHINYSQEARGYSMLLLLTVSQLWLFYATLKRPRASLAGLFILVGTASSYTHHMGLINQAIFGAIAACVLFVAWKNRDRSDAADTVAGLQRGLLPPVVLLAGLVVIGLAYVPQLDEFIRFATSPEQLEAKHTVQPSIRFFYDVLSRWGSGDGFIAVAFGVFCLSGIATLVGYRDARSGFVLLLCAPLMLYMLVPFSKFFSIRYAITALPAFTLLCALGAVRIADLSGRLLGARQTRWAAGWVSRAVLATLVITLLAAQLSAYAIFRRTTYRCSTFYLDASVLTRNEGFCQRFIVLNSESPTGSYILGK